MANVRINPSTLPTRPWGFGSKVQKPTFSEHGRVSYQMNGITNAATWKQIFCLQIPRPWGFGQNSFFSEYGHVAYQIKGNDAYCKVVANSLPADPSHRNSRGGVKIQHYQNMVMLQIKLSGITNAATF